ncbi:unnamed protein product [Ranitomeya imitator]|uniref:Reverse transcriptase domain-containing protein n=1 Tax=Ranitomeya imitator TaxID=111125 RepID=A0ABN9L2K7_9NEOB|nr:unnamed protein product [Ranitomeya imitator]
MGSGSVLCSLFFGLLWGISVRKCLAAAGLPATQYSGHSFRIGAATEAARWGLGPDPMLVWIMGHSYVVWAALRAAVRPDGRQLGLSRETVTLRWIAQTSGGYRVPAPSISIRQRKRPRTRRGHRKRRPIYPSHQESQLQATTPQSTEAIPQVISPNSDYSGEYNQMDTLQIINLSNYVLSPQEISVLSKGLTFSPVQYMDKFILIKDLFLFCIKIILQALHNRPQFTPFFDQTEQMVFQDLMDLLREGDEVSGKSRFPHRNKSRVSPPFSIVPAVKISFDMAKKDIEALPVKISTTANLTPLEKGALSHLKTNCEFIIREADKGGNIVLWPHDMYLEEAHRQLDNNRFYRRLPSDPTGVYATKLRTLIDRAFELGIINKGERDFIWVKHPVISTFYMLPKIHKDIHRPPGRPIVSSIGRLCEKACTYIDFFLQPLMLELPSYIRDSSHFITSLQDITLLPGDIMVTCDVEPLYSNIDHDHGLRAALFFLDLQQNSDRLHDSFIVDLLDFILKHNFFLFDRTFFLQVSGVAMGARCAPALANLFLGWWESTIVYNSPWYKSKVRCWLRFIDDIFFIWSGTQDELGTFINSLNDNAFNIFLTSTHSPSLVCFLDLNIVCQEGVISTCLYRKPTATNTVLEYHSFHPPHTKRGVPVGQFLRTRRNCTQDGDFRKEAQDLTLRLKRRAYPNKCISQAYQRARLQSQASVLKPIKRSPDKSVQFITGYNTHWSQTSQELRRRIQKHLSTINTAVADLRRGGLFDLR